MVFKFNWIKFQNQKGLIIDNIWKYQIKRENIILILFQNIYWIQITGKDISNHWFNTVFNKIMIY